MADAVKWKSILKASWGKLVLGRVGGRPQGRVNGSGPLGQQWPTGVNITCTASVAARVRQTLTKCQCSYAAIEVPGGDAEAGAPYMLPLFVAAAGVTVAVASPLAVRCHEQGCCCVPSNFSCFC